MKLHIVPSRRDDLESLIYVVLFLFFGQLPWHKKAQTMAGRERLDYVIRMKQAMPIESYGPEIPGKKLIKAFLIQMPIYISTFLRCIFV